MHRHVSVMAASPVRRDGKIVDVQRRIQADLQRLLHSDAAVLLQLIYVQLACAAGLHTSGRVGWCFAAEAMGRPSAGSSARLAKSTQQAAAFGEL